MANEFHDTATGADIHVIIRWTWANAAARTAQSIASADVGKVGLQSDTGATYVAIAAGTGTVVPLGLKLNTDGSGLTWTDNNQYIGALAILQTIQAYSAGYNPHTSCKVATTTALPAGTYNNGTAGVGATFTVTATGTLTVDGHVVLLNERVLVKNQASQLQNGVYICTTQGAVGVSAVLTRDTDSDSGSELLNASYVIDTGTTNAGTQWYVSNTTAPTVGTDAITFAQIPVPSSGGGPPGTQFNAPLSKSGNNVAMNNIDGLTAKTTPVGADEFVIADSAASLVAKKLTATNLAANMPAITTPDISISGLTGATTASRYVGGVAGAAPASGTFSVGDFVVDTTMGGVWTCITAGTPGTWVYSGPGLVVNHQTGTSYTIALSDWGKVINCDNAGAFALTMPANGTTAIPQGFTCGVYQGGAGQVTLSVTTDTLRSPNGAKTSKQYSLMSVSKIESATVTTASGDTTT